jgi:thiol-disulfide isomerase/thioredoxin
MKRLSLVAGALVAVGLAFVVMGLSARTMVQQTLPPLELQYLDAAPEVSGKPLLLEFWATWCGPCRTSIPHLNEINKRFKDRGLVIVGVTDEDPKTVRQFTREVPIEYSAAIDPNGKLSRHFGISGIPHAFLVNKSGQIVWEGHPMSLNDAEIEKILP